MRHVEDRERRRQLGGGDRLVGSNGHDILIAVGLSDASCAFNALDSLRNTWLAKVKGIGANSVDTTDSTINDARKIRDRGTASAPSAGARGMSSRNVLDCGKKTASR